MRAKSYTTGSIAKGRAGSSSRLVASIIARSRSCASARRAGAKMKPIPPPDIPPSIQKPQKSSPKAARVRSITSSVYRLLTHGMMVCSGPKKLAVSAWPKPRMSPAARRPRISSSVAMARPRATHSSALRSRYFSVAISRMGPTFCAIPPCTSTSESCRARRAAAGTRSGPSNVCRGSRHPRLMPCSGSPGRAGAPSMSLIPGHSPPESCQPPPDPPNHSPRIARAATIRRSASASGPSRAPIWPVARIQTPISAPSRLVDTARREPLGIRLTLLTSSKPRPGPNTAPSSAPSSAPERSMPGGTMPAAITAAFNSPRWSRPKSNTSSNVAKQADASRSTLASRITGSSMTRK